MTWSNANAWREILERVFEGFEYRENVSPAWMTNPYTGEKSSSSTAIILIWALPSASWE